MSSSRSYDFILSVASASGFTNGNSIVGVTSQTVEHNKEMTNRLGIPFDVLSDAKLELKDSLSLPTFSIDNKIYLKRLTLIIEKKLLKKFFILYIQ